MTVEIKNIELLKDFVAKHSDMQYFNYFLAKLIKNAKNNFWAIGIPRQNAKDKKDHYIWHKNTFTKDRLIIELSNIPV